jgi:hypothetical protein
MSKNSNKSEPPSLQPTSATFTQLCQQIGNNVNYLRAARLTLQARDVHRVIYGGKGGFASDAAKESGVSESTINTLSGIGVSFQEVGAASLDALEKTPLKECLRELIFASRKQFQGKRQRAVDAYLALNGHEKGLVAWQKALGAARPKKPIKAVETKGLAVKSGGLHRVSSKPLLARGTWTNAKRFTRTLGDVKLSVLIKNDGTFTIELIK